MNGKTDWDVVAAASGIDATELAANERRIDPALDAIARWIRDTHLAAGVENAEVRKPAKTSRARAAARTVNRVAPQAPEPPSKPKPGSVASARVTVEFPEALFKVWEDPTTSRRHYNFIFGDMEKPTGRSIAASLAQMI